MTTLNLPTGGGLHAAKPLDRLSSAKNIGDLFFSDSSRFRWKRLNGLNQIVAVKSPKHIRDANNNNVNVNYDDDINSNFSLPLASSVSEFGFLFFYWKLFVTTPYICLLMCGLLLMID